MSWPPLTRHITVILLLKVLALALIYAACFAPAERAQLSDRTVADAVLGPDPRHAPETTR